MYQETETVLSWMEFLTIDKFDTFPSYGVRCLQWFQLGERYNHEKLTLTHGCSLAF